MVLITLFQDMSPNERHRDSDVGDILGYASLLDHVLTVVAFNLLADRLIALGDLIVRGLHIRWSSYWLIAPIRLKGLIPEQPN